jgi:hypothetical protein
MIFHVTLEQSEDGWEVVGCPALPGCVSQGREEKEALENIKEAIMPGYGPRTKKLWRGYPPSRRVQNPLW